MQQRMLELNERHAAFLACRASCYKHLDVVRLCLTSVSVEPMRFICYKGIFMNVSVIRMFLSLPYNLLVIFLASLSLSLRVQKGCGKGAVKGVPCICWHVRWASNKNVLCGKEKVRCFFE